MWKGGVVGAGKEELAGTDGEWTVLNGPARPSLIPGLEKVVLQWQLAGDKAKRAHWRGSINPTSAVSHSR